MTNILLSILIWFFIWSEFYHLLFGDKIYAEYNKNMPSCTILFYITRVVYLIFIVLGFFTEFYIFSILVLFISLLKLVPFFKIKKTKAYDDVSTISCIFVLALFLCKL